MGELPEHLRDLTEKLEAAAGDCDHYRQVCRHGYRVASCGHAVPEYVLDGVRHGPRVEVVECPPDCRVDEIMELAARIKCDSCRAQPGSPCRTATGKKASKMHSSRVDAAVQEIVEPVRLERQAQRYLGLAQAAVREWQCSRNMEQVATAIRIEDGKN